MQLRMRLRARLRLAGTDGTLSNAKNRTHPEEYGLALGQRQLLLRRRQRALGGWLVAGLLLQACILLIGRINVLPKNGTRLHRWP